MKRLLVGCALVLAFAAQVRAATLHEQHANVNDWFNSTSSVAATFTTKNTGPGNLYWATVYWSSATANISSITDTESNTWTLIGSPLRDVTNGFSGQLAYAKNVAGGTKPTVTPHFDASVSNKDLAIHEVSGADTTSPLDGNTSKITTGSGTDSMSTDVFTTTANGDYVAASILSAGQNGTTVTAGTTYTLRASDNAHSEDFASESGIQTTASASTVATFTVSGFTGAMVHAAAFKAAAGGGAPTCRPTLGLLGVSQCGE